MATKRDGKPRSSEVVTPRGRWAVRPSGLPATTPDGEAVTWVMNDKPERLAFGFVERRGRIVWSSFAMLGGPKRELSARGWRTLGLAEEAEAARSALIHHLAGRGVKGRGKERARSHAQAYAEAEGKARGKRTRGTRFTQAELEEAARLYREGIRFQSASPLAYVQAALIAAHPRMAKNLEHRSSAQRRVDAARRAGLIGENEGRRKARR